MNDFAVDPEDFAPAPGSDEREIFEAVHLGVEAKKFMESKLATYICEKAEARAIKAQNELSVVNPGDVKKIINLQAEIAKFSHFIQSLSDIVAAGDSAYQLYLNQQSN